MLPVHPQPKEGEILSSWLVRLAFSNGFPLHTFFNRLLGYKRPIWTRDIDRHPSDQLLQLINHRTQQPFSTLQSMTLRQYEGTFFSELPMHGDVSWLLALGVYHRNRKRPGMQYCPLCMQTDSAPYYRLLWRIASTVICPIHSCLMEDVCPQCQSPVMFHRHGIGRHKNPYGEDLRHCHQCLYDLGATTPMFPEWPDHHSVDFLIALISHPELSPWRYLRVGVSCSIPFFTGLRAILRLLNGKYGPRFETIFCGELGTPALPACKQDFEYLRIERRLILLLRACWLLQEWPDRFIDSCNTAHLSRSRITEYPDLLPYWLEDAISRIDQRVYSPTQQEVLEAAAYLVRRGEEVSWQTLSEVLGVQRDWAKKLVKMVNSSQ
ncbi:TniQ protein [Pseudomonas syringae pv. spinaceae]|uniref:TniQ family protein n=1 Tax=Pseudomonas syringae pv. spinaceae TaxID=264459 RepID=A0A0Q0CY04_PSESX|nr:TniQ family protein [Pseudomonas syringae]KPY65213.1 TniQ family protein [Pseudomonas syringae pv. spinaceae]RMT25143.1 TniQ protein [Pseudomonas syringae pv. spinaceae]